MELPRSAFYYRSPTAEDRLKDHLDLQDWTVNRKVVLKIMRASDFLVRPLRSFIITLKKEEVYLSDYRTPEEAQRQIQRFIERVYNQKRLHSRPFVPP